MTSAGVRLRVTFTDGSSTERMEIEFPLGHPRRRTEAHALLRTNCAQTSAPRTARSVQPSSRPSCSTIRGCPIWPSTR
jgi:2-methylcitrate dehydratase PrpD